MNRFFMWLQKINSKHFLSFFLIFSNFWIYKILTQNFLIGIILIILTFISIFKPQRDIILICIAVLTFLQFQTTSIKSLTLLDNDEQRVQSERIKSYPPTYIDLGLKVIWLKPADWIEKNGLIIGLSRIEKNFFENLDMNKYFFGAFPRNKPEDFEKFPFFYLPIFILGIYLLFKKNFWILAVLFVLPVIILTFIGSDNKLGPFILFPIIVKSILAGLIFLKERFKGKKIFHLLLLLVSLSFILQVSYGKN